MTFFNKKKNIPFFIAEVGQNHQGSLKIALDYVDTFSNLGASAIKFQMRNNKKLFSKKAYNQIYNSKNAFDEIYGKHREKLELSLNDFKKIKKKCIEKKVYFMATPFDEDSLEKLCKIGVDIIKIASFDLGNLSLIEKIAKKKIPVVISIGGGQTKHIESSIKLLKKYNKNVAILHCNSEYPTPYKNLGLENITKLKKKYRGFAIGSSDHFNGILSGPIAYMLGAKVFEKHVTFNRSWKGTDHIFSLMPEGFRKFVRDIKRTPYMLKMKNKSLIGKEEVFKKLGKSLILRKTLKKNSLIKLDDLTGMIFLKNYIPVRDSYKIIGKKTKFKIYAGDPLEWNKIK